jgi:2-phospho-L-lactate guanylyltransferase
VSGWTIIVPVKGVIGAKTRLGVLLDAQARQELALAFARDTHDAVARTPDVERIVVVTDERRLDDLSYAPRTELVSEGEPRGLNAAVGLGIRHARSTDADSRLGVLLGDLPSLRSAHLALALDAALEHRTAFLADWEGTGTTLLTAAPRAALAPAFGAGSAAAHRGLGHVELVLPETSTVRRDVDTPDALAAADRIGVGRRTRAVLDGLGHMFSQ